jgi:hypothetical protein
MDSVFGWHFKIPIDYFAYQVLAKRCKKSDFFQKI